jgi:hypothetical protein
MPNRHWLALPMVLMIGCLGTPAFADDIRPEAPVDARPLADEKCIEQCDTESDECMQAAGGDAGKIQVCDDKYSECLQKCEGG